MEPKKVTLQPAGKNVELQPAKTRSCGHPFFPTFDIGAPDGLTLDGYCVYCMIEKLGLTPCIRLRVNKREDWKDRNKIKIVFNK